MAAIDHFLSEQPACGGKIDAKKPYFREVRERVTAQAAAELGWSPKEVRQQMGYTEECGTEKERPAPLFAGRPLQRLQIGKRHGV